MFVKLALYLPKEMHTKPNKCFLKPAKKFISKIGITNKLCLTHWSLKVSSRESKASSTYNDMRHFNTKGYKVK